MKFGTVKIRGEAYPDYNVIAVDGRELPLAPSLKLRNHSPSGFNWGYGGSGPAQAALAICLRVFANQWLALELYQEFKFRYVAGWPMGQGFYDTVDFDAFLADHPEAVQRATERQELEKSLEDCEE
jgi:Family of unknown function (DUF6166)